MSRSFFRRKRLGPHPAAEVAAPVDHTDPLGRRHLSSTQLVLVGLSSVVGSGLFLTPGVVAKKTGSGLLLAYVAGAVVSAIPCLCIGNLASWHPSGGGLYSFAYVLIGELPAYMIGVTQITAYALVICIASKGCCEYIFEFIKIVDGSWSSYSPSPAAMATVSAVLVLCAALVNFSMESRRTIALMQVQSWMNYSILALFLVTGLLLRSPSAIAKLMVFDSSNFLYGGYRGFVSGTSLAVYAFPGAETIATFSEECEKPTKQVPRAIAATLFLSTVLYVAVGLVLLSMVPASKVEEEAPLSSAFQYRDAPFIAKLVALMTAVIQLPMILAIGMAQQRIVSQLAKDRLFPKKLELTDTSKIGFLITGSVSVFLTLVLPLSVCFSYVVTYMMGLYCCACFLSIVRRHPNCGQLWNWKLLVVELLYVSACLVSGLLFSQGATSISIATAMLTAACCAGVITVSLFRAVNNTRTDNWRCPLLNQAVDPPPPPPLEEETSGRRIVQEVIMPLCGMFLTILVCSSFGYGVILRCNIISVLLGCTYVLYASRYSLLGRSNDDTC